MPNMSKASAVAGIVVFFVAGYRARSCSHRSQHLGGSDGIPAVAVPQMEACGGNHLVAVGASLHNHCAPPAFRPFRQIEKGRVDAQLLSCSAAPRHVA